MPDHDASRIDAVDLSAYAAYRDAGEACGAVLEHLRRVVGFRYWAVTRLTGQTYAIVRAGAEGFPAEAGEQIPWTDTLCREVLLGRAPRAAADVTSVHALHDLDLVERWHVRSYLTAPLTLDGVTLYGTICAIDPEPQPQDVVERMDLVDRQARLLSTVLANEMRADDARRRAERAETEAMRDPLTGLVNRRGWDLLLEREEQRSRRYGTLASVLMIDLDGLKTVNDQQGHAAGDALLRRTARVLRDAVRSADLVARLGGDEFAVLTVETDLRAAHSERDRLRDLLAAAGVPASVGAATREPDGGLAEASVQADADMYSVKARRSRPEG